MPEKKDKILKRSVHRIAEGANQGCRREEIEGGFKWSEASIHKNASNAESSEL